MERELVSRVCRCLDLQHHIVGVNFVAYKEEYDNYDAQIPNLRRSICGYTSMALNGEKVKFDDSRVSCNGGALAVGLREEHDRIKSGRVYEHCGLYSSHAVARSVNESMTHIPHRSYALAMAPLEDMDEADIVVIMCTAKQAMRIIQGYTYIYGCAKNLSTVGNQAMCSDMIAKPFMNNDINITLMCCGARINTRCSDGEMGVSMPIQMFWQVAKGIIATLNVTETPQFKKELVNRLNSPDELGYQLDPGLHYGKLAGIYVNECLRMEEQEEAGNI